MTQEQKNKEFERITKDMLSTYSSKNALYGDSFNQLMYEYGLIAGIIPLDNKVRRIKSIIQGTEVKYESLEDSLKDLANYAILMLIHLKEKDTKVVKEDDITVVKIHGTKDDDPCLNCSRFLTTTHTTINPCEGCSFKNYNIVTISNNTTTGGSN